MNIKQIHAGYFKLDGGAMFGIVPKQLWQRKTQADENNMCTWAMRCLLVEIDDRKILVDTGIGNKQSEKFRSHFEPHGDESLEDSLQQEMLKPDDITDVFLTHLHFDHCGGALMHNAENDIVPTFPNATYWCNKIHYDWAYNTNIKEAGSFLKENFVPLREAGRLDFIEPVTGQFSLDTLVDFAPGFQVAFAYGHTEAMMLPVLTVEDKTVIYGADLIPSSFHISMPYVMSYDVRPLVTLHEKEILLNEAVKNDILLIYEHDPTTPSSYITKTENGRFKPDRPGSIENQLGG